MKSASLEYIRRKNIDSALDKNYRQYLVGHLMREHEDFTHIESDIEVGVSYYREFTADKPHFHKKCTGYSYVLAGQIRVRILDGSAEEYEFSEGDLFIIHPTVPYVVKNSAGTKILFIKAPAGNDKVEISPDEKTRIWLSSWD